MSAAFENVILSAKKAAAQFSVTQGKQSDNIEVLQEFAEAFMAELQQLVHLAGGDNSFLTPVLEGLRNDIDLCFFEKGEPIVTPVFQPRPGLLTLIVKGASMR